MQRMVGSVLEQGELLADVRVHVLDSLRADAALAVVEQHVVGLEHRKVRLEERGVELVLQFVLDWFLLLVVEAEVILAFVAVALAHEVERSHVVQEVAEGVVAESVHYADSVGAAVVLNVERLGYEFCVTESYSAHGLKLR